MSDTPTASDAAPGPTGDEHPSREEREGWGAPLPRSVASTLDDRPDPKWVRGRCPECGDDLVSNMYYIGGKGYLIVWQCWNSLSESPACTYRRVL